VRLNNRLRRIVEAALGGLTLMAPDPGKRLEAAQAVLKSKDANALPALDQAIAKETDARVKRALVDARAAVVLYRDDASEEDKIDAIAVIRERGDQDALALLGGLPASAAPAVKKAAVDATTSIQNSLAVWDALRNAWYGLSLGSVLLLAAIGLAITFGVMGVINMAHGEMVMLGAYTTFVVQEVIRAYNPALFDYSLAIAIPLAFLVAGFIGILIERGIIRFLYGRPLETLLLTWGVSLMIQQGLRLWFGAANVDVSSPKWLSGGIPVMIGVQLPYNRLFIIGLATVAVAAMYLLLFRTDAGLRIRAVTQNRGMAACLGVRSRRVDALTFALGAGLAGVAGCALTQIGNVGPELGQNYIVDSFMVVVTGGVGKLLGTILAALGIGGLNKIIEPSFGAVFGKVAILVVVILFIQRRPSGLFAAKGRYADS
jgi:urea transport system permease protein